MEEQRKQLEKDLIISAERITDNMLVRTPEVNVALIISVAQTYAKRLSELNLEEKANNE